MAGNIKHPDWPYGPHPLTVGLELEFLVNPQLPAYEDENLQDLNVWNALVDRPRKAHRMLAQGLAENTNLPIAVQCEHGLDESCSACKHSRTDRMITLSAGSLLSVYSDHSIPASVQAYPSFNYNVLVTEWLSGLPPTFNGKWEGIEVNTTVYKSSDLKEGLPQLHQLIRGLRLVDMPVGLARGCSLHVHASYSDGMSLPKAQKVVSLVLILEKLLLIRFCSPQRQRNFMYFSRIGVETRDSARPWSSMRHLPPRVIRDLLATFQTRMSSIGKHGR